MSYPAHIRAALDRLETAIGKLEDSVATVRPAARNGNPAVTDRIHRMQRTLDELVTELHSALGHEDGEEEDVSGHG